MPKIPKLNTGTLSTGQQPLPTESVQGAGMVQKAYASLGGEVAKLGESLFKKYQKEALMDYGQQAEQEFLLNSQRSITELQRKYSGTDHEGYYEEVEKTIQSNLDDVLQKGSTIAQRRFARSKLSSRVTSTLLKAESYKMSAQSNFLKERKRERLNSIIELDDPTLVNDSLAMHKIDIENTELLSPEDKERSNKAIKTAASEYLERLANAEDVGSITTGMAILKGEYKGAEDISKNLEPSEKSKLERKFNRALDRKRKQTQRSILNDIEVFQKAVQSGEISLNAAASREELSRLNGQLNSGIFEDEQKSMLQAEIAKTAILATIEEDLELDPDPTDNIEEASNRIGSIFGSRYPFLKAAFKGEIKDNIRRVVARRNAQIAKDPASYFTTRDSELSTFYTAALSGDPSASNFFAQAKIKLNSYYDQFNIPETKRKYLPNKIREHFKGIENFVENKQFEAASKMFLDLKYMAGNEILEVVNELGFKNRSISMISEVYTPTDEDGQGRRSINPANIKLALETFDSDTREQTNQAYAGIRDVSDPGDYVAINKVPSLLRSTGQFYSTYSKRAKATNDGALNAEAALDIATHNFKRIKIANQNVSNEEAARKAWELFTEGYQNLSETDPRVEVLVPRSYSDPNHIRRQLSSVLRNPEQLEYKIDPGFTKEDYHEMIEGTARWFTSSNGKAAELYAIDPRIGDWRVVVGKDGNRIVKNFDDLMKNDPEIKEEKMTEVNEVEDAFNELFDPKLSQFNLQPGAV